MLPVKWATMQNPGKSKVLYWKNPLLSYVIVLLECFTSKNSHENMRFLLCCETGISMSHHHHQIDQCLCLVSILMVWQKEIDKMSHIFLICWPPQLGADPFHWMSMGYESTHVFSPLSPDIWSPLSMMLQSACFQAPALSFNSRYVSSIVLRLKTILSRPKKGEYWWRALIKHVLTLCFRFKSVNTPRNEIDVSLDYIWQSSANWSWGQQRQNASKN